MAPIRFSTLFSPWFLTRLFIHGTNFLGYTVYVLEGDEHKQDAIYKGNDCAVSQTFKELKIHLDEIF